MAETMNSLFTTILWIVAVGNILLATVGGVTYLVMGLNSTDYRAVQWSMIKIIMHIAWALLALQLIK